MVDVATHQIHCVIGIRTKNANHFPAEGLRIQWQQFCCSCVVTRTASCPIGRFFILQQNNGSFGGANGQVLSKNDHTNLARWDEI